MCNERQAERREPQAIAGRRRKPDRKTVHQGRVAEADQGAWQLSPADRVPGLETGLVAVVVFHELFARRLPAFVGKEGEHDAPNDSKREFDRGHGFSRRSCRRIIHR